jgi:hypothetical protein
MHPRRTGENKIMNDRGEKIVSLAREMLRAEELGHSHEQAAKTPVSFKVLCFTAMLAALGGSAVTGLANEARRPLNRYEKVELDALVFYAARLKGLDENTVRQDIEARVGVGDFDDFTERDYRAAKDYLRGEIR